jgi:hypothetical protein
MELRLTEPRLRELRALEPEEPLKALRLREREEEEREKLEPDRERLPEYPERRCALPRE